MFIYKVKNIMGVRSVKRKNRFSSRTQKRGGSGTEGSGTKDICPICREPLHDKTEEGDSADTTTKVTTTKVTTTKVTTSNCKHLFHEACLNNWCIFKNIQNGGDGDLETAKGTCTCPICREPVVDAVSAAVAANRATDDYDYDATTNFLLFMLFNFIVCATLTCIGKKIEDGCNTECIIQELLDLFRTRGGTLESTPTSKTRTPTSKTRTPTSKTRTPTNMRNTIRSKKGSPSMISPSKVFPNNVLPSKLLNLNVGSTALKIIKKWILDNIDKVKDEKLKGLINELLKTGEESLSKLSKTNSPTSSPKTVRQFIVENKEQFYNATQAIYEGYTKSK